jgi:hypothetical protein
MDSIQELIDNINVVADQHHIYHLSMRWTIPSGIHYNYIPYHIKSISNWINHSDYLPYNMQECCMRYRAHDAYCNMPPLIKGLYNGEDVAPIGEDVMPDVIKKANIFAIHNDIIIAPSKYETVIAFGVDIKNVGTYGRQQVTIYIGLFQVN